jgi:hypothetical protein
LDLGDLAGLKGGLGLLSVRYQGGIRGHIGARGDGCWVTDTFQIIVVSTFLEPCPGRRIANPL